MVLATRMASSQIGKIGKFIPSRKDWTQYVEHLEHLFLESKLTLKRALSIAQSYKQWNRMFRVYRELRNNHLSNPQLLVTILVNSQVLARVFALERAVIHQQSASLRMQNATSVAKWGVSSQYVAADQWTNPINH